MQLCAPGQFQKYQAYMRNPDGYLIEIGQVTGVLEGIFVNPLVWAGAEQVGEGPGWCVTRCFVWR